MEEEREGTRYLLSTKWPFRVSSMARKFCARECMCVYIYMLDLGLDGYTLLTAEALEWTG